AAGGGGAPAQRGGPADAGGGAGPAGGAGLRRPGRGAAPYRGAHLRRLPPGVDPAHPAAGHARLVRPRGQPRRPAAPGPPGPRRGTAPWPRRRARAHPGAARGMAGGLAASRYATDLLLRQPEMVAILGEAAQLAPRPAAALRAEAVAAVRRHAGPPDAVAAV